MQRSVIAHTHWDREWFATVGLTRRLLIPFFDRLWQRLEDNPDFHFVLDGQMSMVCDYLDQLDDKGKEEAVGNLRQYARQLFFGPYFGQIDWRIVEEAGFMNLEMGIGQAQAYGKAGKVAWLMDNFGLCGQLPQVHRWFGIEDAAIWRGVDFPGPCTEFVWKGSDGSRMLCAWILESYRNLMHLGDYPEVAEKRLQLTIDKLKPFSKSGALPLMDGYDLDPVPEDPSQYIEVSTWLPDEWLKDIRKKVIMNDLPTTSGELLSGRIACAFPGSLSARAHLKWYHGMLEHKLSHVLQPLQALLDPCESYEKAAFDECGLDSRSSNKEEWRILLENLIHDSIGGVGVDDVHDEMEQRYRDLEAAIEDKLTHCAQLLADRLPDRWSSLNFNPCDTYRQWEEDGRLFQIKAPPGLWTSLEPKVFNLQEVDRQEDVIHWENPFFKVSVSEGAVDIRSTTGSARFYPLVVEDRGDTYSSGFGKPIEWESISPPTIQKIAHGERWMRLHLEYSSSCVDLSWVLTFSDSPLVQSQVSVQGKGCEYACMLRLESTGEVMAGMPFEHALRPRKVEYAAPSEAYHPFLVAAREVGGCDLFPFKGFVGMDDNGHLNAFLSPQVFSYRSDDTGISVILTRSVQWLSKSEVPGRVGDAGPMMYTPRAAMKRRITFDIGLYVGMESQFPEWKASFLNPPIVVSPSVAEDLSSSEPVEAPKCLAAFWEDGGRGVVCSTLRESRMIHYDGKQAKTSLARFYNPTGQSIPLTLSVPWQRVDHHNHPLQATWNGPETIILSPKQIVTIRVILPELNQGAVLSDNDYEHNSSWKRVRFFDSCAHERISPDHSVPDEGTLQEMQHEVVQLRKQAEQITIHHVEGSPEDYTHQFERLKLERTAMELELAVMQNRKSPIGEQWKMFSALNDLRIKRRGIELLIGSMSVKKK